MHLDQQRARAAFGYVQALPPGVKKDFLSLARSLPVMFQTNGLLATWAHLLAKRKRDEDEYGKALEALVTYLSPREVNTGTAANDVFRESTQFASLELRKRTAEAIEYAVWLKRAAEALCDTEGAAS